MGRASMVTILVLAGCGSSREERALDAAPEAPPAIDARADADAAPTCPADLRVDDQGLVTLGAPRANVALPACAVHRYAFAAAESVVVTLELRAVAGDAVEAAIAYPDTGSFEDRLLHVTASAAAPGVLEFTPSRPGEFFVFVRATAPAAAHAYDLTLRCTAACDRETTRFPIVLVHGWTGWDRIGSYEYFYQVPETLRALGYRPTVVTLDPYNSIEVRAGQLAAQVDQALAEHRARRVDLVAHSQGGLDSRRLVTTLGYGDRVSSLVTIATPHRGTTICDVALGYVPGPGLDVLSALLDLLGAAADQESNARASFHDLSERYIRGEFNPATPDDPRVAYFSLAGQTCRLTEGCGSPVHAEIALTYELLLAESGPNDGVVPVSSAPWGTYLGTVAADHFDEVGQLAGQTGSFDHLRFYTMLARALRSEGH